MALIRLGKNRWGEPVYMVETGSYNVIFIIAKARYGKSVLIKNLYTQIAQYRPIITFDYQGEHSQSKWGNWKSKHRTMSIPDLYTVSNFGFYLSDFDEMQDWISMGFSSKGAPLLMELLQHYEIHQDSPRAFLQLLSDLPSRNDQIDKFNEKYAHHGLYIRDRIHDGVKHSLISAMNNALFSGLIIPPEDTDEHRDYAPDKKHIENWQELVKDHNHININLNIVTSGSVPLARASVGKILDKILPVMDYVKPLIVVEEGDFLCPNTNEENITSLYQLRNYVLKHQRTGVELAFVSQDPNLLDQFTLMGGTVWIMGHHISSLATSNVLDEPNQDYLKDVIHKLHHDKLRGVREFAIMYSGYGGRYEIFQTDDPYTRIP